MSYKRLFQAVEFFLLSQNSESLQWKEEALEKLQVAYNTIRNTDERMEIDKSVFTRLDDTQKRLEGFQREIEYFQKWIGKASLTLHAIPKDILHFCSTCCHNKMTTQDRRAGKCMLDPPYHPNSHCPDDSVGSFCPHWMPKSKEY